MSCLRQKVIHNLVDKFSQGLWKVFDEDWPGHPAQIVTEAAVWWVGEIIPADRQVIIDRAAPAIGCSYGLTCSIVHDWLNFCKLCVHHGCPDRWQKNTNWSRWACPCNVHLSAQMKKICLTRLLQGRLSAQKQGILQCSGDILFHLQWGNSELLHQQGRLCLQSLGFPRSAVSLFPEERWHRECCTILRSSVNASRSIQRKNPDLLITGGPLLHNNAIPHTALLTHKTVERLE